MLKIKCVLGALPVVFCCVVLPAQADNPFEPDQLDNTEIKIEKQPQEKADELTPYLLYGYKKDKLFMTTRDGNYVFVPTFTLQLRHQNAMSEGALQESGFRLRRARTQLDGNFLTSDLKYEVDLEFRTPREDDGPMRLQDFYLDYRWNDALHLRAGQFKVPFSYQFVISGTRQQFNERSIANAAFSPGRDIGLLLHGKFEEQALQYSAGLFNGEGQNVFDGNQRPAAFAKVQWTPLGRYLTEESDLPRTEEPRVLFSAQSWSNADAQQNYTWSTSAFAGFKWRGLSLQSHGFQAGAFSQWGGYAQAGYFFLPKWEGALRYAHVHDVMPQSEYAAAVNYYLNGHHLKFQLDYTLLQQEEFTHRVIGQMQLSF